MPRKKRIPNPDKFKGSWEPQVFKQLRGYGIEPEYEPDKIPYVIEATYTPDFKITDDATGKVTYLEAKGYFDAADRRKLLAVLKHNDVDVRMVFQADSKIHKASSTRYSEWCNRHGIQYCIKVIPKEWFVE
jgi:hypothetical protein